jgi:ribosome-associated heat shock protein Hsp15
MTGQRLDKWLWCARLVKTRTLAAKLIDGGKVRVNGVRSLKASRLLRLGDVVTGTAGRRLFVVRVIGAAERRGAAASVAALYEDLMPPAPEPPSNVGTLDAQPGPRPTKRERRKLDAFKAGRD